MSLGGADAKPIAWPLDLYRLVELGEGPPGRLATCVRHCGQHIFYLNGCFSLPAHDRRYLVRRSRPEPAPAVTVQIDENRLGVVVEEAMVAAIRRAREERSR